MTFEEVLELLRKPCNAVDGGTDVLVMAAIAEEVERLRELLKPIDPSRESPLSVWQGKAVALQSKFEICRQSEPCTWTVDFGPDEAAQPAPNPAAVPESEGDAMMRFFRAAPAR